MNASRELISNVTDVVADEIEFWRNQESRGRHAAIYTAPTSANVPWHDCNFCHAVARCRVGGCTGCGQLRRMIAPSGLDGTTRTECAALPRNTARHFGRPSVEHLARQIRELINPPPLASAPRTR